MRGDVQLMKCPTGKQARSQEFKSTRAVPINIGANGPVRRSAKKNLTVWRAGNPGSLPGSPGSARYAHAWLRACREVPGASYLGWKRPFTLFTSFAQPVCTVGCAKFTLYSQVYRRLNNLVGWMLTFCSWLYSWMNKMCRQSSVRVVITSYS
jgi:hypothetical protein